MALDESRGEVEPEDAAWTKQPYHSAVKLETAAARQLVARGIEAAQPACLRQMRAAAARLRDAGHAMCGCSIVGNGRLPDWSVEQILAVHMRMHKAERVLYPAALKLAAAACDLTVNIISEAELNARAAQDKHFGAAACELLARGKSIGAPWGKDQKSAALAALGVLLC